MRIKFSVLVPLYNTPENFLREMLESVQNQTYKEWELCLADASDEMHAYVSEVVAAYAKEDTRIKYTKLSENRGISENTNACIDISTGNYYALLDHDDVLDKNALKESVKVICKKKADFIYTDEAKFTNSVQEWFEPNYKPDFAKYELRAHNYICHLTVYSRELLGKVGRYRREFDGSQDYDMVLRLTEKAKRIVHIPKVLYYWRVHSGSVAAGVENKSYAIDAAKKAVFEHVTRCEEKGEVITHTPFSLLFHTIYKVEENSCVTVVLFGPGNPEALKRCIESLESNAGYENFEYLIITEKESSESFEVVLKYMKNIHAYKIISENWDNAKINKVLKKWGRDYLLFLNVNSKIKVHDFLKELLMLANRKDVGWVGPKILNEGNAIKHAGIALTRAVNTGIVKRFHGELAESMGYEAGLHHIRNVSALSDECMIIQADKFWELGGLSDEWEWYTGIDMCLKAMRKAYNNVWTPYAQMVGLSVEKTPLTEESKRFVKRWKNVYSREDQYYNKFIRYDLDNIHDKNTPYLLLKKAIEYWQRGGFTDLCERIKVYRGRGKKHSSLHMTYIPLRAKPPAHYTYKDVLFINGCAPTVPHPPRYRVTHQREQLTLNNISNDEVYYEDLELAQVQYYRMFIIFRCPYTDVVGKVIEKARGMNKQVLYDIDDLVIDRKYTDTIPFVMQLNPNEKRIYDDGVVRMGKTLSLCDAAITTTEGLAKELSHYVPEVFINRNVASDRMHELSEKAIFKLAKEVDERRKKGDIRIGYFSGSPTHNDDFQMVLPSIAKILGENPMVQLYIVGELELPNELKSYMRQVVATPFIEWEQLPELIASVDINLAPITKGVFNEAKSENKWVEAALVKVPTVASNIGAFKRMIIHNETGVLCNTEREWYEALNTLIYDDSERKRLGEGAYQFVKRNCVTINSGKNLADYIRSKLVTSIETNSLRK
ncbi:glycosyltransferase [Lacrimispora sp.]|jgi:glycosyltransferase involved in cell wall biosynthesis|uniref:glycosyltransferase n=1 Tax=Lacrimispora sp. TaxID=2719234 RepID=UPI0028AC1FC7|nr:glycosyltransferase [Lacrimispora sp.]